MKQFLIVSIAIVSLIIVWFIVSSKPIPYSVISARDYKLGGEDAYIVCTELKIKVDPNAPRSKVEKLLMQLLTAQYGKSTKFGKSVESFNVGAFSDNEAKNYVGYLSQVGSQITFTYDGQTTYLQEEPISREEKARQEAVGKFAGELLEAGKKYQNK